MEGQRREGVESGRREVRGRRGEERGWGGAGIAVVERRRGCVVRKRRPEESGSLLEAVIVGDGGLMMWA